jgi:hypothetical protein
MLRTSLRVRLSSISSSYVNVKNRTKLVFRLYILQEIKVIILEELSYLILAKTVCEI